MSARIISFDTETTGLDFATGDRVIELGAVEILDRNKTGEEFQTYLNPDGCLLYTSPSPRDQRGSRMPSSA